MSDRADAVFDALGDPRRRQVVQLLARGPATPTELARGLPISRQAVTKHLGVLQQAGLVSSARHGREVRYSFEPAPLTEVLAWLARAGKAWDERLARLQAVFESSSR